MLENLASYWQIFLHKIHANFTLPFAIEGSAPGVNLDDFNPTVLRNRPHAAQVRQPQGTGLFLPSKALP